MKSENYAFQVDNRLTARTINMKALHNVEFSLEQGSVSKNAVY